MEAMTLPEPPSNTQATLASPGNTRPMSRWQAAGIHLMISLVVGALALALVALVWYPPPLLTAARGHELVMLLTGVDIVLGPLLTLAVFKAGKWGMKFDLVVIGVLQMAALIYGVSIMAQARPAFIVHAVDRFELVSASELEAAALAQASDPQYRKLPLWGPSWVIAQAPALKTLDITMSALSGGPDLHQMPEFYQPLANAESAILARAKPIADLVKANGGDAPLVNAAVAKTGYAASDLRFLPLRAKKFDLTVLVHARTGAVVEVVNLRPW
jgi:hypothetical protein